VCQTPVSLEIFLNQPCQSSQRRRFNLNVSTLVLGCRDLAKGKAAKKAIVGDRTGAARILVWKLDMADYSSVKSFGQKVVNDLRRVDAVLANAGTSTNQFALAEDLEQTLTVNVFSTFLLSQLCLPALEQTAKSTGSPTHLTIVGSNVHAFADHASITSPPQGRVLPSLSDKKSADMNGRYFLSKLLVQLCTQELAARTPKSAGIPSVIINPDWCRTTLFRQDDGGAIGRNMLRLIGRTGEVGARTLVSAITAGPETHGKYLSESQVKNASVWVRSIEGKMVQKKIWSELEEILSRLVDR
jgi:retinol dehydrogenase-12